MPQYEELSPELAERIERENAQGTYVRLAFDNQNAIRRDMNADKPSVWRPAFLQDIDKIIHCPFYNRYTDKTQVFSLVKNDDITRRSLHVQLVSRIARTIGGALHLNTDLIEAIALGHDMGHPPFGHMGEKYLDAILCGYTGRHFSHNIHSVRVLDGIYPFNISLQTLSGIAGHNGEAEQEEYWPEPLTDFAEFDRQIEKCYEDRAWANKIAPNTLEGMVVRIADIIAYLGRDRQDAERVKMAEEDAFAHDALGRVNGEIVNNLMVNIIENSYGKPCLKMDKAHFKALSDFKKENYAVIYDNAAAMAQLNQTARPMMAEIYGQLLDDLKAGNRKSPIFTHHIQYVNHTARWRETPYEKTEPNQMVVDYIASMTDDYFIDLHHYLFPSSPYKVEYKGYFD